MSSSGATLSKPRPVTPMLPIGRGYRISWTTATVLFLLTGLTTFWAGACCWIPVAPFGMSRYWLSLIPARQFVLAHWLQGLQFSASLLCILFSHEMGHYLLTRLYRVPATPPIFLPMPISPLGTFGAVIAMDGFKADRREVFDIGIGGPLAGLVATIPFLYFGIIAPRQSTLVGIDGFSLGYPLLVQWLADLWRPGGFASLPSLNTEIHPFLMASWTGLLVTGLNMVPMGQLDGGHVTFGIFGKGAVWIARAFLATAVGYMIVTQQFIFVLMLVLVLMSGLRHPPTRDDSVKVGVLRTILGLATLSLPFLCIPLRPFTIL